MHTLEEVQEAVKRAVDLKPRRRNPFSYAEYSCLNTGRGGAHCIAAQVLVDLGYDVPGHGEDYNTLNVRSLLRVSDRLDRNFSAEALEYLEKAQGVFDSPASPHGSQRRQWTTAYRALVKHYNGGKEESDQAEAEDPVSVSA